MENRRQVRVSIGIAVSIRIDDGGRGIEDRGEIANLSQGGMLLKVKKPLPERAKLVLRILWPPSRTCMARGEVIWQKPGSAGIALSQPNADYGDLLHQLELTSEAERRELIALLRVPVIQIDLRPARRA
ncbi:MAG TPA: PilZ domain-containing protein [Kofleriaceae bacterium]